jgi:putative sterol carrier protein
MTLQDLTTKITALAASKPALGRSVAFDTDLGTVFVDKDGSVSNNTATPADCTIGVDIDDLMDLINGSTSAITAFMFGKLKISGDMGVAMKLKDLFS